MKENSREEDIKTINNFMTYFNKNIQDGYKADLTVLGEEIEALNHILSDYKRVLKENEQLQTEVNSSKKEYEKYKRLAEMNLKSAEEFKNNMCEHRCLLKSENEILQKENEELKEYLITQNCEINRLNLEKIRLELSQVPDTTEQYKYLKNEYKMRLERTDLENYKSNYISIQKVKDKIEYLDNQQKQWLEDRKLKVSDSEIIFARDALQELLEGRK